MPFGVSAVLDRLNKAVCTCLLTIWSQVKKSEFQQIIRKGLDILIHRKRHLTLENEKRGEKRLSTTILSRTHRSYFDANWVAFNP